MLGRRWSTLALQNVVCEKKREAMSVRVVASYTVEARLWGSGTSAISLASSGQLSDSHSGVSHY